MKSTRSIKLTTDSEYVLDRLRSPMVRPDGSGGHKLIDWNVLDAAANEIERLRSENSKLKNAVSKLSRAILDKGKFPKFHDYVNKRHRAEWPTLWKRIDELLNLTRETESLEK